MKFIYSSILFLFSGNCLACKPTPGPHPSLQKNFSASDKVVIGKIMRISSSGLNRVIRFVVEKTYKGKMLKEIDASTSPNTCNQFGEKVKAGDECVFFIDRSGTILSGLNQGPASNCAKSQASQDIENFKSEINQELTEFSKK